MYISPNNKTTRIEPKKVPYYNTFNLDLLLGEMQEVKGTDAVVDFLKEKLKYYKAIQKEGK